MNFLVNDYIGPQGAYEQSYYFKNFETDWCSKLGVLKPSDDPNSRTWENFAVFNNANFTVNDDVLEFGAWPAFGGCHVASYVRSITITDAFLYVKSRSEWTKWKVLHPNQWMLKCESFGPNIKALESDIQKTDFKDKKFDKIISYGVLEHVIEDLKGMNEMARILKDDGLVSMTIDFSLKPWEYRDWGRCYGIESIEKLVAQSNLDWFIKPDWNSFIKPEDYLGDIPVWAMAIILKKRK